MEQDDQGFMWLATSEGIQQYDGYRFRTFSKATHPLRAPLYQRVINVGGQIWVIPSYRDCTIDIIDPITQEIRPFEEVWPDAPSTSHITAVSRGPGRSVLIGTDKGEVFQCGKNLVKRATLDPDFLWMDAFFPNDSTLWLVSEQQWCQLRWQDFPLNESCETLDIAKQSAIRYLPEGLFMVKVDGTTKQSKLLFKRRGMLPEPFYHTNSGQATVDLSETRSVNIDRLKRLWLYNSQQIKVFDAVSGTPVVVIDKQDIQQKTGHEINFSSIYRAHFDQNNIAWLPTNKGVIIISITANHFQKFLHGSDISTRGMARIDTQHIVVGTYKGVYEIDLNDPSAATLLPTPSSAPVALLYEDPLLWIVTHESSMIRLNRKTGQARQYYFLNPLDRERQRTGFSCYRDAEKCLWVGTEKGVFRLDEQRDTLLEWLPSGPGAGIDEVHQFVENSEGLWLVAGSGLYLKPKGSDKVISFAGFAGQYLYYLHIDRSGVFWLGTRGGGLMRWDRKINEITRFTTADGLSNNTIYAIFEDERGGLWMSTNMGINVFDRNSRTIQVFSTRDGLADNEFNYASCLEMPGGPVLLGGLDGLVAFYPERLPLQRKRDVPLYVWNLQYYNPASGNMEDALRSFHAEGAVTLPPSASNLLVEFALSDMFDPSANRFAYMLDGVSPEWQYIRESYLRFGSLPYGTHMLRIRGFGSDGVESKRELVIPIIVERPYYMKPGFWVLLALGMMGIFFALMYWRTRQLRRAKMHLERLVEARTRDIEAQKLKLEKLNHTKDRLFAIIAHELRNPVLQLQDFSEKVDFLAQKGAISRIRMLSTHLGKTTAQVREILENLLSWGKIQTGRQIHRPRHFELQTVTADVLKQIQPLADQKSILLKLEEEQPLYVFSDPNNLEIILRNLLYNAVKFTPLGGTVTFRTKRADGQIHLEVSDTGVGMEEHLLQQIRAGQTTESSKGTAGERGTGLGLSVCRDLVAREQGQIHIDSEIQKGTTVTIFIPFNESVQDIYTGNDANTPIPDR